MPQQQLQLYAIGRSKHLPHDLYVVLNATDFQMHRSVSKAITEANSSAETLHAEDRASSPCPDDDDDDDDGQGGDDDAGKSSLPSPAAHRLPVSADLLLTGC